MDPCYPCPYPYPYPKPYPYPNNRSLTSVDYLRQAHQPHPSHLGLRKWAVH